MSRRADAVRRALGWLVRGALLALWSLVGWGTLLLIATAAGAIRDGPGVALSRLVPSPGASLWAWLNGLTGALALSVWLVVAALVAWERWDRRASPEEPGPET
jgi:hypothetical protein